MCQSPACVASPFFWGSLALGRGPAPSSLSPPSQGSALESCQRKGRAQWQVTRCPAVLGWVGPWGCGSVPSRPGHGQAGVRACLHVTGAGTSVPRLGCCSVPAPLAGVPRPAGGSSAGALRWAAVPADLPTRCMQPVGLAWCLSPQVAPCILTAGVPQAGPPPVGCRLGRSLPDRGRVRRGWRPPGEGGSGVAAAGPRADAERGGTARPHLGRSPPRRRLPRWLWWSLGPRLTASQRSRRA